MQNSLAISKKITASMKSYLQVVSESNPIQWTTEDLQKAFNSKIPNKYNNAIIQLQFTGFDLLSTEYTEFLTCLQEEGLNLNTADKVKLKSFYEEIKQLSSFYEQFPNEIEQIKIQVSANNINLRSNPSSDQTISNQISPNNQMILNDKKQSSSSDFYQVIENDKKQQDPGSVVQGEAQKQQQYANTSTTYNQQLYCQESKIVNSIFNNEDYLKNRILSTQQQISDGDIYKIKHFSKESDKEDIAEKLRQQDCFNLKIEKEDLLVEPYKNVACHSNQYKNNDDEEEDDDDDEEEEEKDGNKREIKLNTQQVFPKLSNSNDKEEDDSSNDDDDDDDDQDMKEVNPYQLMNQNDKLFNANSGNNFKMKLQNDNYGDEDFTYNYNLKDNKINQNGIQQQQQQQQIKQQLQQKQQQQQQYQYQQQQLLEGQQYNNQMTKTISYDQNCNINPYQINQIQTSTQIQIPEAFKFIQNQSYNQNVNDPTLKYPYYNYQNEKNPNFTKAILQNDENKDTIQLALDFQQFDYVITIQQSREQEQNNLSGLQEYELKRGDNPENFIINITRLTNTQIKQNYVINSQDCSRNHVQLRCDKNYKFYLDNYVGRNGTFIKCRKYQEVLSGMLLQVGNIFLEFKNIIINDDKASFSVSAFSITQQDQIYSEQINLNQGNSFQISRINSSLFNNLFSKDNQLSRNHGEIRLVKIRERNEDSAIYKYKLVFEENNARNGSWLKIRDKQLIGNDTIIKVGVQNFLQINIKAVYNKSNEKNTFNIQPHKLANNVLFFHPYFQDPNNIFSNCMVSQRHADQHNKNKILMGLGCGHSFCQAWESIYQQDMYEYKEDRYLLKVCPICQKEGNSCILEIKQ